MFTKPNLFHGATEASAQRNNPRPASTAAVAAPGSRPAEAGGSTVASGLQTVDREDAAAPASAVGESRLIVGPEVKLKGAEILDCDTLVVEGRVEATMDSRVLRIAEKGAFKGTVGIDIAEIHGHFEGELTARKQLLIHATGRVSGKIRYGKILIEEGGELSGDVQSLSAKEGLRAVETRAQEPLPIAAVAG
ncbi:polymer-forming cytoskeletal protein [Thauera sp.]|uniref:bactofilin family protein n=1 Tax=Thauera sp. TaxID=1905334 RepID=UPI002B762F5A|nr:polymer-forming cytoskeletal protein [Thauera sp.]HRO35868.1 polymer-forming cytoskeletal protein [Thauera sp.]